MMGSGRVAVLPLCCLVHGIGTATNDLLYPYHYHHIAASIHIIQPTEPVIHRHTLVEQFKHLGLHSCPILMVHASMRKTGPVDGGAEGLIEAILEAMGSEGTMIMPLGATEKQPFDALTTPAHEDMGILAEVFRHHPKVQVNDHAASRFGAIGPDSKALLEPMPLHNYHGHGSVLSRFSEMGGSVLRLGADIDTVTVTHWAEYLAEIPYKRLVRRRYERADIGEQWIESLDDCEGIAYWGGGDDYFSQILIDFLDAGKARVGPVGNCTAELFEAQSFVDFAVEWMEANL